MSSSGKEESAVGRSKLAIIATIIVVIIIIIAAVIVNPFGDDKAEPTGTVRIYTSVPLDIVNGLKAAFEENHTGITLDIYRAGTSQIMERIHSDMENNSTVGADVIWVADTASSEELKEEGILMKYESPESEKVLPIMVDPDGYYTGSRLLNMVIIYNKNTVTQPPTNYTDLLDVQWKDNIAFPNPDTSGSAFFTIGAISQDARFGWDYLANLSENGCAIVSDNEQLVTDVASGKYAMGIGIDFSARNALKNDPTLPLGIVYPSHGVVAVTSPIALCKDCNNTDAAKCFIDWVLSPDCQEVMSQDMGICPVRTDVAMPEGMVSWDDLVIIPSNAKAIYQDKEDIFAEYHQLFNGE